MKHIALYTQRLPHPGLLAAAVLGTLVTDSDENLEESGTVGDTWGMENINPQDPQPQFKTVIEKAQGETDAVLNENLDTLDAMASFITLGDRITHAIKERSCKEMSASALSRALDLRSPSALDAMQRPSYKNPEPETWMKIRKLALLTGFSFLWIRDGKGKHPVKLTEEEAEEIRSALGNEESVHRVMQQAAPYLMQSAPLNHSASETATPSSSGFTPVDFYILAAIARVIHTLEHAKKWGWSPFETFNIAARYFNEAQGHPNMEPEAIAEYAQKFNIVN